MVKFTTFSFGLILLSITGCGWVDSTGNQASSASAQIDPTLVILDEGDAFPINENTQRTVVFSNADNRLSDWSWSLLDSQANIQKCLRFDNFERLYASNSLRQACASDGSCEVQVAEISSNNTTQFIITTPHMRSPAALEYRLRAKNATGGEVERRQTVCAIPINNAPIAQDDPITVMRGTTLRVSGDDTMSLLANDTDDEDERNQGLTVITTADIAPAFAANFQLFEDGGFIYQPLDNAPLSSNGSISDKFTYSITDGFNTSRATARIRIVAFNSAPTLNTELREIQITIGDYNQDVTFFRLQDYFSDAENDELTFFSVDNTMPESGNIYITDAGLIDGNPDDDDSGRYLVKLAAYDSFELTETDVYLNIVRSSGKNKAPYADDIDNRVFTQPFQYDVSQFFFDADNDHLSYTATRLPSGIQITSDGVIYGTPSRSNRGVAFVRVTANDGNGGTNSDGFRLTIR